MSAPPGLSSTSSTYGVQRSGVKPTTHGNATELLLFLATNLSNKLPTGREGETEGLRVIFKDVLDAVVELHVYVLHVIQCDLLA